MSKVDEIVAAHKALPKLPEIRLGDGSYWTFSVAEEGQLYVHANGYMPREHVPALIAWLVENYGEGKA